MPVTGVGSAAADDSVAGLVATLTAAYAASSTFATYTYVDSAVSPSRTAALWPFRHDSPWNLPVATTAEFEASTDTKTAALISTGVTAWVNWDTFSHPVNQAASADPLATVTDTTTSTRSDTFRIPAAATIASGGDAHMHVVTPDGRWVDENFFTARSSSTVYTAARHEHIDLYGSGLGPANGVRAYGGSAIGGLIRSWEATAGYIRHALAFSLASSQLYRSGGSSGYDSYKYGLQLGYVWPATEQDADSSSTYAGVVPMGTYFAIPPSVDVEALSLSAAGKMVARALQRYGGYVTDRSSGFIAYAEPTVSSSWISAARTDMSAIRALCRVVINNTAATPNGGVFTGDASNRVATLAPALSRPPKVS